VSLRGYNRNTAFSSNTENQEQWHILFLLFSHIFLYLLLHEEAQEKPVGWMAEQAGKISRSSYASAN
jgi:hypothetical protein